MTSVYLQPEVSEAGTDQILVPAEVWAQFDVVGSMFAAVGDTGLYGRLCPATPEDRLPADSCRVPQWMYERIEEGSWLSLTAAQLDTVTHLVLRARHEADVLAMDDPVLVLSVQLSAWAVLSTGQEVRLPCGVFDVIELHTRLGPAAAGCILDTDVTLEFVPALDAARPPTPIPQISPPFSSPSTPTSTTSQKSTEFAFQTVPKKKKFANSGGFIPFSGMGYTLGK